MTNPTIGFIGTGRPIMIQEQAYRDKFLYFADFRKHAESVAIRQQHSVDDVTFPL